MILRLILGDQLNYQHSWFNKKDENVLYVLMEVQQETGYVKHHIQKIVGFFLAMRNFADYLEKNGHKVEYIKIGDNNNLQEIPKNIDLLIDKHKITCFQYQMPDEYRLDSQLKSYCKQLSISTGVFDTEHFYSKRDDLKNFFDGSKQVLMERFYRHMRKKHNILMENGKPAGGNWNYDQENRKKLPGHPALPDQKVFNHDVSNLLSEIKEQKINCFGNIDPQNFSWPAGRDESLQLLSYFNKNLLPFFGTYQDAMTERSWGVYHSRLSYSLNTKMISPKEVVHSALEEWHKRNDEISISQVEGFIRQIMGWREFMRGIYWWKMSGYERLNFFEHKRDLPVYYWNGKTKMNCMHHAISQSLDKAYAHHIQRLMVTGNFALLTGTDPNLVDDWYLGIYMDAIQWVEITNTRGMSQFADGGLVATKPYISSASYIHKMSDYCKSCHYKHAKKYGEKACPFNSLFWNFLEQHRGRLDNNQRLKMMYRVWDKMKPDEKSKMLEQAATYLDDLDVL